MAPTPFLDPTTYPQPLKQRAGIPTEPTPGGIRAPRTRLVPWVMSATASSRRSLSTPRIVGPLIIKDISFTPAFASDPPASSIEVGWAPGDVTEAGVALATPRPYSVLTELVNPFGAMTGAAGAGYPNTSLGTDVRKFAIALDLILTDAEGFVVVSFINNSISTGTVSGYVRIIENLDPEVLHFFL